jgi:hypothetical protein
MNAPPCCKVFSERAAVWLCPTRRNEEGTEGIVLLEGYDGESAIP